MVRIQEWKKFEMQARTIFAKSPDTTRFSIKHTTTSAEKDGIPKKKVNAVIKVTDDKETITYETTERFAVKRISTLMKWFTVKMASTTEEELKDVPALKQRLPL